MAGRPTDTGPGLTERRVVTALFCDVAGSTSLAESMDPEDWSEVVNAAVAVIADCVGRYGGTMSQFAGDSILALFGAPVAHEDDPYRAIRAALDIVVAVRDLSHRSGVDLHVRQGLNTGLVVVGGVGAGDLSVYSALGDVPNVAARLQSLAEPDTVLVSADTHRLVVDDVDVAEQGTTSLKGRTRPVTVYEVTGVRGPEERRRGVAGLSSPLVGRGEELEVLRSVVNAARRGHGSIAAVLGEPGVGKSRLVAELGSIVAAQDETARWAAGRCVPFDDELPLHLVGSLVRSLAGVTEAHEPDVAAKAVRHLVATTLGDDQSAASHLLTLLGLPGAEAAAGVDGGPGDADLVRAGQVDTLRRLLSGLADQHDVVVLVCEDLHWVDVSSTEVLTALLPQVRSLGIVLLLVMRPDQETPGWTTLAKARDTVGADLTVVELAALAESQSLELIANLLAVETLPADLRRLVLDKAGGNPFFLEEVVRMLVERGLVEEHEGRWGARPGIGELDVPSTIQGLLASRIDRLPAGARRTGRVAAVIGRRFPATLLAAVDPPESDATAGTTSHPGVVVLEAHAMVESVGTRPEPEYAFRHALIHDVLYDGLLRRERRHLHDRVARAIEELHAGRTEPFAAALARHHERAGHPRRAIAHHLVAAEAARRRGARAEAHRSYQHAAELLERTDGDPSLLVRATLGSVTTGRTFVQVPTSIARLERVLEVAEGLDDPDQLARVYATLVELRGMQGENYHHPAYRELLDRAAALAPTIRDQRTRGAISSMVGLARRADDEHAAALDPLTDAIDRLEASGRPAEASLNASMLADSHATQGRFALAEAVVARALALAHASADANAISDAILIQGRIASERGDLDEALMRTNEGIAAAEQAGNTFCTLAGNFFAADQELRLGRTRSAITHLERSTELARFCNAGGYETLSHAWLASARARIGEAGPAAFDEPLAEAVASRSRSTEALVRLNRAIVLAHEGDLTSASADFERAIALFDEIGALPSRARAQHAYGLALEAAGRPDEATAILRRAASTFDELGGRPDTVSEPRDRGSATSRGTGHD